MVAPTLQRYLHRVLSRVLSRVLLAGSWARSAAPRAGALHSSAYESPPCPPFHPSQPHPPRPASGPTGTDRARPGPTGPDRGVTRKSRNLDRLSRSWNRGVGSMDYPHDEEWSPMPALRSRTVTHGRNMAGARALMQASGRSPRGLRQADHRGGEQLHRVRPRPHPPRSRSAGSSPRRSTRPAASPREFNTIAVDDGIAMGHGGMLYSLPSRDLIADSVEYMVEAHCADALVCISNCDKITPGMLMAALRLNIPTVFVSGGPMEAGKATLVDGTVRKLDLIDAMSEAVNENVSDADLLRIEENACPTCGSCSGMFTANSMNCLTEAIGLALPGNGSVLATHTARKALYEEAGRDRRRDHPAATTSRTTPPCCRATSPPGPRSRTRWRWTSRWAARPTRSCTCSPPRRRPSSTSAWTTSTRSRAGCRAWRRSRRTSRPAHVPHGGRAPRRRHPGHPRRAAPRPAC